MKKYYKKYSGLLGILCILFYSCTDSFVIESIAQEDALVIEASITNENKNQIIYLSKAYKLTDSEEVPETNAIVVVKDENQVSYTFTETTPGTYVSNTKFSAQIGVNYQLSITTTNGKVYESKPEKTISNTVIENVNVELDGNIEGTQEFRLFVNSFDPTGNSKYYRYTYEETYKIEAPFWSPLEAIVNNGFVSIVQKADLNQKVCYQTNTSNTIIQTKTTDLSEDRVQFAVRRIPIDDYKISNRYSLLVKQYVQSYEAHTYYNVLNKFSNASDLLSQSQPGFFSSNIYSTTNNNEKVLGFFEVTSVSEKRVFINYRDYFPVDSSKYIDECYVIAPSDDIGLLINEGKWIYYKSNENISDEYPGPYLFVQKGCGDCTEYGTNIKPAFWVD